MRFSANLHIHTTYSDGGKAVAEVIDALKETDVKYFSITDHDQVRGNIEAAKLAKQYGLSHCNGVELSCCFSGGEIGLDATYVCHIVGLDFNLNKMQSELDKLSAFKTKKIKDLFKVLIADGYNLDDRNIFESVDIERKKIAKDLIAEGYAQNANEAFDKILNSQKYVEYAKNVPSIKEAIEIIHSCGGLAVWAHPFGVARGGKKELTEAQVTRLADSMVGYRIDAMEVYYQHYSVEQIEFLKALAEKYKLLKSIGTDYHDAPPDKVNDPAYAAKVREQLYFEKSGVFPDDKIIKTMIKRNNCFYQYSEKESFEAKLFSPEDLEEIKQNSLKSQSKIEEMFIPASVKTIYKDAFYLCGNLKNVYFGGTENEFNEITVVERWSYSEGCYESWDDYWTEDKRPLAKESVSHFASYHGGDIDYSDYFAERFNTSWYNFIGSEIYFYSDVENRDGNHWRFVGGVPAVWERADDKDFLNVEVQLGLGYAYYNGEDGKVQNRSRAVRWFIKAADQGNVDAQYNAAYCYAEGEGVHQDKKKAVEWYEKACEQGHAASQNNLASIYRNGREIEKNLEKAVELYKLAAEQGYSVAQHNLANCYFWGEGVPKDLKKSREWLTKAAEQGDIDAQFWLGERYYNIVGFPKNRKKSREWWQKAAEQGDKRAIWALKEKKLKVEDFKWDF